MKAEIDITHMGDTHILESTIEVEINNDQFSELRTLLHFFAPVQIDELDSDMREILQLATDDALASEDIDITSVRKVRGNL